MRKIKHQILHTRKPIMRKSPMFEKCRDHENSEAKNKYKKARYQ